MLLDLALYAELLIPLFGAFMYGFLARELVRHRTILPGNLPVRLLALGLTLWYAGSLADELVVILLPSDALPAAAGAAVDVVRAIGWLASFPLLAHTIWRMIEPPRPRGWWVVPGYVSLSAFVPSIVQVIRDGETVLTEVSRESYALVVIHVSICTLVALRLVIAAARSPQRRDFDRFFRSLFGVLLVVEALVLLGAWVIDVWSAPLWRILVSSSGLIVGAMFLYFVRRYNLWKLSLSNRSLRHFAVIAGLLFLVLLGGPVVGGTGQPVFHRVLAWGILLAILAGLILDPVSRAVRARFPALSRQFRRGVPHSRLAKLSAGLKDLERSPEELKSFAAAEIGQWTGTEVRFVEPTEVFVTALAAFFQTPETEAFSRLRAPTSELADVLTAHDLHAVFPLRISERLDAILLIPSSAVGGGYEDGEMESVQLGLDGLGSALEIRELADERLATEQRLADQDRLSMLGMVSASLAHELKNPLSSMKALAQTVKEEIAEGDPSSAQVADLGVIVEQVDRLNDVAREILGFARPRPQATIVAVDEVIASTVYVLDHEARRRGITIASGELTNDSQAAGTPATWQTIVFNLIVNAIRHAPDGSTVKLRLLRDADALRFECENEGEPVPDELEAELFTPFVSGERGGDGEPGSGLGLALVSRRVAQLGGRVMLVGETGRIIFRVEVPSR